MSIILYSWKDALIPKEKANNKPKILIYNSHDSHIFRAFRWYYFENNILILLLLPYSSPLMQLLDIKVFSSLKAIIKSQLDIIFRIGITQLYKSE